MYPRPPSPPPYNYNSNDSSNNKCSIDSIDNRNSNDNNNNTKKYSNNKNRQRKKYIGGLRYRRKVHRSYEHFPIEPSPPPAANSSKDSEIKSSYKTNSSTDSLSSSQFESISLISDEQIGIINHIENNNYLSKQISKPKKKLNLTLNTKDSSKTIENSGRQVRFAEPEELNDHDDNNAVENCLRNLGVSETTKLKPSRSGRFDKFSLDINVDTQEALKSWKITDTGTFKMNEFEISKDGEIHQLPFDPTDNLLDNNKKKRKRKTPQKKSLRSKSITQDSSGDIRAAMKSFIMKGIKRSVSVDSSFFYNDNTKYDTICVVRDLSKTDSIGPNDLLELDYLGKGAGGIVTRALHIPTFTIVAVKQVDVFQRSTRHQLVKELRAFQKYSHENLVRLLGAYFHEGRIAMVLEYMNRGSLENIIQKYGPLNEDLLRSICCQVVSGLIHIHSLGGVHRDIKPANILVNHKGEIKIADFGIAGHADLEKQAQTFTGTMTYMSPERIQSLPYSDTADVWSLGLLLFHCALGKFPFDKVNNYFDLMSAIIDNEIKKPGPEFSKEFRAIIDACLKKDPNERWNARQLLHHPFLWGSTTLRNKKLPKRRATADVNILTIENNNNKINNKEIFKSFTPPMKNRKKIQNKLVLPSEWGWTNDAEYRQKVHRDVDTIVSALVKLYYDNDAPLIPKGVPVHNSIDQKQRFTNLAVQLDCDTQTIINVYMKYYNQLPRIHWN